PRAADDNPHCTAGPRQKKRPRRTPSASHPIGGFRMSATSDNWRLYIDGKWHTGEAGEREVTNPATGEVFAKVPEASPAQAQAAIAAARRAQPAWGRRAPIERARIMRRISSLIRRDAEALARIVVTEQGKPILEARGEAGGA